jgi:hypothetical protein
MVLLEDLDAEVVTKKIEKNFELDIVRPIISKALCAW